MEVVERHEPVWEGQPHKFAAGAPALARLARAQVRLLRAPPTEFDALIVGYPGHLDVLAARRVAGPRPVAFNPLVSLWDTFVDDRRRFRPGSIPARLLRALDRRALRAADLVIADTEANAALFADLAGLPASRVAVCFVGAEERVFQPGWTPPDRFRALFVGKLIPLHGVETILAAAELAPDVAFTVVGGGQLDGLLHRRPANVEWVRWVPYERLGAELHGAGCALGVFGMSAKAQRVIPNKAFQALACGTPLITADTPAARELLDDESALLVPPGDPHALAAAVRRLAADPQLAVSVAARGHETYRRHAAEDVLGRRWRALIERLL